MGQLAQSAPERVRRKPARPAQRTPGAQAAPASAQGRRRGIARSLFGNLDALRVTSSTAVQAAVIVICLLISATAAWITDHSADVNSEAAFQSIVADNRRTLENRFDMYRLALDVGSGFHAASENPTSADWRRFVESLNISASLPGANGLGLILPVRHEALEEFEARVHAQGDTNFKVHPDTGPGEHFVVRFIEPAEPNAAMLGLDLGSDPLRRAAALAARDSGQIVMAPMLGLARDPSRQPKFMLLRPLYRVGAPLETVEDRRIAFRGWVYVPFVGNALLEGITLPQARMVEVEVFAGHSTDPGALLYTSRPAADADYRPRFVSVREQAAFGRDFTIRWTESKAFAASQESTSGLIVLIVGVLFTIFLGRLFQLAARRETDIRRQVEAKTRELVEKTDETRSILDNATIPVLMLDADRRILSASTAIAAVFGFTEEEVVGRPVSDLIPDIDNIELSTTALAPARHKTGQELWVEVHLNCWMTGMGHGRYTLVIRDATELQKTALVLRETENRWNMALTGAKIGVFDVDLTTGKSVVSDTWRSLMGLPLDDEPIDTKSFFLARVNPEDLAALEAADAACIAGLTERSIADYRIEVEPGHWRWMRSDALVVARDADGRALRLVGAQTDITNIRKAEEALRSSREQFRMVLESAPVGMAVVDASGEFVNVNAALCEFLRCAEDDIWDLSFPAIMLPEDNYAVRMSMNGLSLGGKKVYVGEHRFQRTDGTIAWGLLSMSWTLNAAGEIEFYIAQVQDVTEQKELQRTKSEFVATVSHELRTPLTSIKGALGLISGKMADELPPGMARMLEIALNNCNRLSALVNDILDMEKISSGKMTFDLGVHVVNDLVTKSIEEVRPYGVQYGVGIKVQMPAHEIRARLDPARFAQVVANLMSNAVKFSYKGGRVSVRVEEVAHSVRFSVTDNGTGIPESFRSRIFQPFSQADSSDTRKKGGTGLGLNISRQMVEMMGGTIGFRTKEGFGSTFWFELPLVHGDEAEPARQLEAAAPQA